MRDFIWEQCPWLSSPSRNHGQKGVKMIAYHNQPIHEFINQLRDIAINAKARASVIDQIETLAAMPTLDEIKQNQQEAAEAAEEDAREEMWTLCYDTLCEALEKCDLPLVESLVIKTSLQEVKP